MTAVALEIGLIFVLILCNAALAMSEIAVVSSRKARLQRMAQTGNRNAAAALQLAQNPDTFLSTVQIGITLVGVLAGAFGGATLAEEIDDRLQAFPLLAPFGEPIGVGIVVVGITYFSLVLGELVPKRIALNRPERTASIMARPMQLLARVTSPAVRFMTASTSAVLRLLRVRITPDAPVSGEEIQVLIQQSTEAGVFKAAERDLVSRIFKLADRTVDLLMTPVTEMVWLDVKDDRQELCRKVREARHTRYPVCEGGPENVLGVVSTADLFVTGCETQATNLKANLQDAVFVPETSTALSLLERFQKSHRQFAMVIDEHGSVVGLCTLHDLTEAIIGSLPIDAASAGDRAVQREDGSWLLDGALPIDELKELLRVTQLPGESDGGYKTLGGFVMSYLHRVPAAGDNFSTVGLRFEVLDMDGHRVDKVMVQKLPADRGAESAQA